MGIINFDAFNLYEIPDFLLCNPDTSQLYALSAISDRKYSPRFNTLSELSFSAREYIDGTKMPYYDYLVNRRLVYVENLGYFQIVENIEQGDGIQTYKDIKCQSLEVQLITKKIGLLKGTYKFYDPITPAGTLMKRIIDLLPDWSLGTIDTSIAIKYRTFDITDITIYNLLMTKIEEAYECIFVFDTINKTISAYALANATTDTDIYLSYDNVIKNIKLEEISDEYVTSLTVLGGGDLSINQVNPLGTDNIYDFSYSKNIEWMSQGLIDAITAWEALITANQITYANTLTTLSDSNEALVTLQAELVTLQGQYSALDQVRLVRIQQGLDLTAVNADLSAKQIEINDKNSEITSMQSTITSITAQLTGINTLVSFANNFTAAQIEELQPYIIQSGYVNENFIQTSTMTNAEIQAQAQGLYDQATTLLGRISEPRYNFDVESINFPLIKLFESFTDELVLGAIINLEIKPNVISYPLVLGYDLNYDNPDEFKLIFGNRLRLDNSAFQFSDLMNSPISSANTTKVNSTGWSNSASYTNNEVSTFITSALNAATNNVISGSAQNITLTENGLRGRQLISGSAYESEQFWMVNNMLAFTDDNWTTSKLALGKISLPGGGTGFGLVSNYLIGNVIAGNQLTITNENNKFLLDGSGATLIDATLNITNSTNTNQILLDTSNGIKIRSQIGGTWVDSFYADTAGNLHFTGDLSGATGTFSGAINAATITGGVISGTTINSSVINGATGYFSGNIYAANLQGQVSDGQIASISADKITAGTISSVTLNSSVINGATINGGYIIGGQFSGGQMQPASLDVASWARIGTQLTVYGTAYFGSSITFSGGAIFNSSVTFGSNVVVSGTFQANGGVTQYVTVRNSAGTGTTTLKFNRGIFTGLL